MNLEKCARKVKKPPAAGYMRRYADGCTLTIGDRVHNLYSGKPLTVGRANKDCELKSAAGSGAETAATLTEGTAMYVLADCGDWLHVCIPRGEIGYWMDAHGTYGYLRAKDVTQAATPLQLKYTGD